MSNYLLANYQHNFFPVVCGPLQPLQPLSYGLQVLQALNKSVVKKLSKYQL